MSDPDRLALTRDPRLADVATAASPAWLWSADGTRVLWSNAVGAAMFGGATPEALAQRRFNSKSPPAQQVARLAAALPADGASRLERLRGFVSGVGRLLTCRCARLAVDGDAATLVVATEAVGPSLSLVERIRRLLDGVRPSFAAFTPGGDLVHAVGDIELDRAATLTALGAGNLAATALEKGEAAGETPLGLLTLERIGTGNTAFLLATWMALPARGEEPAEPADLLTTEQSDTPTTVPVAVAAEVAPAPEQAAPSSERTDAKPVEVPAARDAASAPAAVRGPEPGVPTQLEPAAAPIQEEPATERRHPLRFVWQVDHEGRFGVTSPEFLGLIGTGIAAALDRPWADVAADLALDAEGDFARVLASHDTFSGIHLSWPIEGTSERLPVELSGLPVFEGTRSFRGYRGFGVCRDLARLAAIAAARRAPFEPPIAPEPTPDTVPAEPPAETSAETASGTAPVDAPAAPETIEPAAESFPMAPVPPAEAAETAAPPPAAERPQLTVVPPAKNVVPFRPGVPPAPEKRPTLTSVERNAFQEIAKALGARVEGSAPPDAPAVPAEGEPEAEIARMADTAPADSASAAETQADARDASLVPDTGGAPANARDEQRSPAMPRRWPRGIPSAYAAARGLASDGESAVQRLTVQANGERAVLDRLPVGVIIYRGDQILHANRALLDWTGYEDIAAIAAAGGLERLFAEPGLSVLGEPGASGQNLAITTRRGEAVAVEGRLFSVPWHGETALLIVLSRKEADERVRLAEHALAGAEARIKAVDATLAKAEERLKSAELALRSAETSAGELGSILETATDGVIVIDRDGMIQSSNRSAEALFGYDTHEITNRSFVDLFAPESHRTAFDYLNGLIGEGAASMLNDGREVIGRVQQGGLVPLFITIGRIADDKLCVVFRDITQWKRAEEDLTNAKREAEKASSAKSDVLAKVSHEVRTPLNAIIGFAEVMMEERLGPIGNERYRQYLKDIRTSGEHVISLVNDLLDLSKIEAGKLELNFVSVKLNDLVQQCVAIMQPQANRERIIIRTSLLPALPPVVADERSIRQIVLNLLSNSIKFTGAGGQVIVSTALTDQGEAVLRVRDTGIGMSEKEIETALEPFRQVMTSGRSGAGTGLGLPLTKVLAEANRATFTIKSAVDAGTLVEITFPATRVLAE
jgi:PAS domain S-box-containing protein